MLSQKFSILSENQITSFMSECDNQKEDNSLLDSIESVSDLWVLANMKETYNEENVLHRNLSINTPDVYFHLRGENTSGCSHRLG